MNDEHIELLTSAQWQRYLQADLLPWAQSQIHLDCDATELLEVGPGPGQMTDLLRLLVQRLVAIEIDPALAHALSARLGGTNVEVICGDAIATDLSTDRFTGAVCFTMLHHIPSQALQDGLFAELHRVLRPGARLIGVDSLDSPALREFHCGDTFVPIDLETMAPRLRAAGFGDITVEVWEPPLRPGQKVRSAVRRCVPRRGAHRPSSPARS